MDPLGSLIKVLGSTTTSGNFYFVAFGDMIAVSREARASGLQSCGALPTRVWRALRLRTATPAVPASRSGFSVRPEKYGDRPVKTTVFAPYGS
jgi:hypothetical protein